MITITIDTDNAAFEDNLEYEVAKCLAQVRVEDGMSIHDTNGNAVGKVVVT